MGNLLLSLLANSFEYQQFHLARFLPPITPVSLSVLYDVITSL